MENFNDEDAKSMRQIQNPRLSVGQEGFAHMLMDIPIRDDSPKPLGMGFHYIWDEIFKIIPTRVSENGRQEGGEKKNKSERNKSGQEPNSVFGIFHRGVF